MSEYILNRISYYQDSLKRFIKSDQPIMLILGQNGSGKTHLINQFCKSSLADYRIVNIDGNDNYQPQQLIACLCQQWDMVEDPELTSHRQQLDNLLNQIHQQHIPSVLVLTNAQNSNIATLAAICHLASIQGEPPVSLHIILSGEVSLEDKINSLMVHTPPCLLLQPLSKKETFQYVKYRLNKLNKSQAVMPSNSVIERIYEHSGGFPSLINHLTQRWLYHEILDKPNTTAETPEPGELPMQRLRNYYDKTGDSIWEKHAVKITASTCLALLAVGFWVYQHKDNTHHSVQMLAIKKPPQIVQAKLPSQVEIRSLSVIKNSTTQRTPEKNIPQAVAVAKPKIAMPIRIKPKHITKAKVKVAYSVRKHFSVLRKSKSKPHHSYVIQLLASRKLANIKHFIKEKHLTRKSKIHVVSKNHRPLYIVTTGHYHTRQQTDKAILHLSKSLKKLKPWPRKL